MDLMQRWSRRGKVNEPAQQYVMASLIVPRQKKNNKLTDQKSAIYLRIIRFSRDNPATSSIPRGTTISSLSLSSQKGTSMARLGVSFIWKA